ncbi:MAG TPA: FapA family protein, partial [Candidatus Kryptobacter bacterium]|nr:FapA family protein [Candidatus Kryptobacter bacterium]
MTISEKMSGVDKEELISKKIKIDVSSDGYEAYLTVDEPDIQMPDIQAAIEANGIAYGIDQKASLGAISNTGQHVLVASGSRHTDGTDAFFEQADVRVESEAEKKFGIKNVFVGDLVGVIHKPTTGSVGIDVYGRKVQPKQGRAANMFTGPNIKRIETGDEIRLEAGVDGNLRVSNASIEILEEHIIHEDIDYSDGE